MTVQRKLLLYFILCVALVVTVVLFRCTVSTTTVQQVASDEKSYAEEHARRKSGVEKHEASENRFTVTKHLWLSDKNPRLELEMKSARSKIQLVTSRKATSCVETFTDAQGIVQEELFYLDEKGTEYTILPSGALKIKGSGAEVNASKLTLIPMQRFRYFEAERAVYDYRYNTLIAYGVDFWTYCTAGHELIHQYDTLFPETSGVASSITLCHGGSVGSLQFSAENLKMKLGQEK